MQIPVQIQFVESTLQLRSPPHHDNLEVFKALDDYLKQEEQRRYLAAILDPPRGWGLLVLACIVQTPL